MKHLKVLTYFLVCMCASVAVIAAASSHSSTVDAKLAELKVELPPVTAPIASFVHCVRTGNLIFVSGQLPTKDGKNMEHIGQLGDQVTTEDGAKAAQLCVLNVLAKLKAEIGSLDKVKRCVKLTCFVSSTNKFTDHPKVANGASDLIVQIFGEAGKHARAAVGVSSLPLGVSVEVEAVFEVE